MVDVLQSTVLSRPAATEPARWAAPQGSLNVEFTLYYRGPLKANRKPPEKHQLRQHFHKQLSVLWKQEPLCGVADPLLKSTDDLKPGEFNIVTEVGAYSFAPLVCSRLRLVAGISITLLRPEPPGTIVTQAGDIDNRLKTLLDALKMPSEAELPSRASPEPDEKPFFCLLEDDSLITKLSVDTDRLLDPAAAASEVVLLLRVETSKLVTIFKNLDL